MIILHISTCESSVYSYRSLMRSRSRIKVKVTSRSSKNATLFPILCQILLISTHYFSVSGYRSLIRSSSYIKVKVILRQSEISTSLQILCSPYYLQAGGLHSTECVLVLFYFWSKSSIIVNQIRKGTHLTLPKIKSSVFNWIN